jgi:hypothetical protein
MNGMRNRVVILVVAAIMVVAMLACGSGGLLSRTEPTATPTKTPKPTFTVTLTPTNTPVPTNTPLPTDTATPTPLPTNTPIVYTATPTPLPTDTPVPTNTPRPTARPTNRPRPTATATPRPQPTNTPRPQFAWTGQIDYGLDNCALTRVFGHTLERSGALAGNVWVHYWADGWDGAWAKSDFVDKGAFKGDEHNWEGVIDNKVRQNTWHICVVPEQGSWNCISNTVDASTTFDCTPGTGVNVVHMTFRKN